MPWITGWQRRGWVAESDDTQPSDHSGRRAPIAVVVEQSSISKGEACADFLLRGAWQ
jgi:hypothetical protein